MSRRLLTLVCACILGCTSLSGCSQQESEPPVVTGFTCSTQVQYGEMEVEGRLTRQSAGLLTMDITAPETLKGMTLEWNGEEVSVKMYGLRFGVDPSTFPSTALGSSLLAAFDAAARLQNGQLTADGVRTVGEELGGEFTLLSDPDTGYLLSLSVPSAGLQATFSDFQLLMA